MATMSAKKIEKRAREIYEKGGVVKIMFDGRFKTNRYGEYETEHYEFDVSCKPYNVFPTGEYEEKPLFPIQQKMRERIATKVKRYVEEVFVANFGEHMMELNAIEAIKAKEERRRRKYSVLTLMGWLLALLMFWAVTLTSMGK